MRNYVVYCLTLLTAATAVMAAAETFTFTIPDAYLKSGGTEEPVILNVTGTGNVKAMPDQVIISAYIYTHDKKASKAYDENASKMRTLMDSLLALGVPKKNIATESVSINTIYKEGSTKVDYFAVHRSIKIFQEDMDTISPILDAIIDAGIEDVGSIDFVVKDLDEKYREALENAAADCRGTAETLAAAMGARVVDLVSMSYDYGGYNFYDVSRMATDEIGGFVAGNQMIVPREVTTTVNVYATYEIEYTGL
jgi:uncharacterized protein YggE